MTTTLTVTTVTTARDLLDAGGCTSLCLLATSAPRACTCRCSGRHHGALLDVALAPLDAGREAA